MLDESIVDSGTGPETGGAAAPDSDTPAGDFAPRQKKSLQGVLIRAGAGAVQAGRATALATLEQLVRQATHWPWKDAAPDARIGDYRFLVLSSRPTTAPLSYVQLWSEPRSEPLMEVGPGPEVAAAPPDRRHLLETALEARGFAVGGGADNYARRLAIPRPGDAHRIATEMLALLIDVIGHDGAFDVVYQLHQGTYLTPAHVTLGIPRLGLCSLLSAWGLSATKVDDDPTVIEAHSHGFKFRLTLRCPLKQRRSTFWEIHLSTVLPIPRERATALVREVNERTYLLKASAAPDTGEPTIPVLMTYGINLAGGVTFAHLKSQVFEWLETVRRLWVEWRSSEARPAAPNGRASPTVH